MRVFPKRLSDAEYVAAVRKAVVRSKWVAVFHGVAACFFMAAFTVLHGTVFDMERLAPQLAASLEPSVRIGMMLGLMEGLMMAFAGVSIGFGVYTLKGRRTERLMLAFHDQLCRNNTDTPPATPSGPLPGAAPPQG